MIHRIILTSVLALAAICQSAAADHWSLQSRTRPTVPAVDNAHNPIDAFLQKKLNDVGLKPAAAADRAVLIRRLTFDLLGLPPTPAEVEAFVNDPAADAYEKVVDRLLASPHYGERWGRHWLDVVRYAESEGFEYDRFRPGAWRYRDYVIKAFNDDIPYDRFLSEQIAGDELAANDTDRLIAAGFHRLGPVRRNAGNKLVAFSRNEVLTEMTDAIGSAFLGLTLGCARCHDHRFDDISQKDYYQMQAFFASAQEHDLVLADAATHAEWKERTERIQADIKSLQKTLETKPDKAVEKRIADLQRTLPEPLPTISTVRNVLAERTPVHVLKRGDTSLKRAAVGPRALSALLPKDTPELLPDHASPRTRLAEWLNDPGHPLVPRVLVNRLWQGHFGKGLVATPNDFGVNGSPPSHPELLDWLANEFVAGGRRIKPIHRMIVLSAAYRQSGTASDERARKRLDPDDRLLSRFPRRRLSSDELRDAMLAVSGRLNPKMGGPSVMLPVEADLVDLLYDKSAWSVTADGREHRRRSVYLAVKRNLQLPFAQAFDQPDAAVSCPRRESSTHPLQALEMLNGKLSNQMAAAFAERLHREYGDDHDLWVDRAFRLCAGRGPTSRERELSREFLLTQSPREFALAMFNLNAFLYVN